MNITADTFTELMRVARPRCRKENQVFNSLKRCGYQFEHNDGRGQRYLSDLFATLAMLAFLIDQIQARCGTLFRAVHRSAGSNLVAVGKTA